MLKINCDRCKTELNEPGGLLFGPPRTDNLGSDRSRKYHLCVDCYHSIVKEFIVPEKVDLPDFGPSPFNNFGPSICDTGNVTKKDDKTRYC